MKITALAFCPPPAARQNPAVTPELCASVLARYSRSNRGIDAILQTIDWSDPDQSVDAIFRFVDYGHASIGGMTGGIPVVIDGCSMLLAYKLFEIAQLCDGQESSTRYIRLDSSNIPDPADIGIPGHIAEKWRDLMEQSYTCYRECFTELERNATATPEVVRVPEGASEKVRDRLRKNYALDRARYYIPFATKTNAAFVMTARVWAETIKQLDSLPLPEAHSCATALREEIIKFAPRLMRHSFPDEASKSQARQRFDYAINRLRVGGLPINRYADSIFLTLDRQAVPFLPDHQTIAAAFDGKENRYSAAGIAIQRMLIRVAWNNIAIAELRDLNRHRSGFRFSPLVPTGFYLPDGVRHPNTTALLDNAQSFLHDLIADPDSAPAYVYSLHLGTQVAFEHSTHLDKFIYEIELRTGMGAHFRYAEHLTAACEKLCQLAPELTPYITVGTAEPE